ncbi:hypothetical protein [Pedobacter ureilyticus]|uniref:Uncharacterized protein n=1 Tax=Pedobacter ureilyticus TaxID=1393051 RepID=A0ABW9J1W2_9SPHI|nr:hypothetical protein [Pedobacter helvus]
MHHSILMFMMGVLGILIYNLYKILPHLSNDTFSLSFFIKENLKHLIWTFSVMIVAMAIINLDPTANDILKEWTGLDLANNTKGWLLFGAGLSGAIRNRSKISPKGKRVKKPIIK